MREKKQIGWYILSEKSVFTNHGQYAAWFEDVEVEAGRYPMYMYDFSIDKDGRLHGSVTGSVYADIPGVILEDYFGTKNTGKDSWAHLSWYGYRVADLVSEGDPRFELLPEYEARQDGEYQSWDGSMCKMYDLYLRDAEVVNA